MKRLFGRIWNAFRPDRLDRELRDELEFHREMSARKARERGLSQPEADREALRKMGNLPLVKDQMRDHRVTGWLCSLLQDLRLGLRLLHRDSSVSALIVAVLALGIGGNAAIFTLMKAAFLDPLPFPRPERLVTVLDSYRELGFTHMSPTVPELLDLRARSKTLEQIAFADHRDFVLTGGEPERVFAGRVTPEFFPMLGVSAQQGRLFSAEESVPGRNRVAVVTDSYWRGRLGSKPIAGQTLSLDGNSFDVIGVLPPTFRFDYPSLDVPEGADIYVPFPMDDSYTSRSAPYANLRRVRTLARLREGTTLEQAGAELDSQALTLAREHPELYRQAGGRPVGFSMWAQPLREAILGRQAPLLWLLAASVALLLSIACANTAQLLLARSLRRRRETSVRAALGASRFRLIRQALIEGAVLSMCGGAIGLGTAFAAVRAMVGMFPLPGPILDTARLDLTVAAFTFAVSLAAALVFSSLPALRASVSLGARASAGEGNRTRHAIIAAEAALSMFLLCGAGSVAQNLASLISTPVGFDPDNVTVMRLRLPYRREKALANPELAYREYLERIVAIPGVESAATVTGLPLRGAEQRTFRMESESDPGGSPRVAFFQRISPGYFGTLRIPLLAGRQFRDDDREGREPVAIVNREFVRRYLGTRNPIGERIVQGSPATIVGVAADVRMIGPSAQPEPQVYRSYLQAYEPNIHLVVRSALPPVELRNAVKAAVQSAYPGQAVFGVTTMDRVFQDAVAQPRFQTWLAGVFALLALAMSASGIYSVISCLVSQRTGEIAIRMALGAGKLAVLRTILAAPVISVSAGLGAGFAVAMMARGAVRAMSSMAMEEPPWIYGAVAALFLAASLAGAYVPMRRASRLDPAVALRSE